MHGELSFCGYVECQKGERIYKEFIQTFHIVHMKSTLIKVIFFTKDFSTHYSTRRNLFSETAFWLNRLCEQ